jgi:AraC family transcriptional regulator of adaptative response / DNA-3-methyladenine glycosylase II
VELDFERCYRAVDSRDPRFDGCFVTAVATTGIYCRPSCPAVTPKAQNVAFYPTAAAAHRLGFRACRRCRPDAAPGSPEWDIRADVVGRAMRLIADGTVDREGVEGLASRLGYGSRHLTRMLNDELGAGPLALARAQRAQTARTLIETTDMPFAEIAFAAGFKSVRQFNDTVREVYAINPSELRSSVGRHSAGQSETIAVRLAYRPPLHREALLQFLALRAIPGVEVVTGDHYTRAIRLPHGDATVMLTPLESYVAATLHLADVRDLAPAVARCRRLLDLDADPVAVDSVLGADPALAAAVAAEPGVRFPRAVDGFEIAMRAIVGQQISVPSAITVLKRIVAAAGGGRDSSNAGDGRPDSDSGDGRPNNDGDDGGTDRDAGARWTDRDAGDRRPDGDGVVSDDRLRPFPEAAAIAQLPDGAFRMPAGRRETIRALATAIADGDLVLDGGVDRAETEAALREIPGIGAWTASYVAIRALGDPDVFMPTDGAVVRGAERAGLPTSRARLEKYAERWAPWRSYAVIRLWRM